jgi:hypothetical protein
MTQIFPTRSQSIGFEPTRRVFARRLVSNHVKCGASREAEKISRFDYQERRLAIQKSQT